MTAKPETVGPYRIYYWFAGVDPKRSGGAWWRRDFPTMKDMLAWLADVRLHLHAYAHDNCPSAPIFEAPDAPPKHAEVTVVNRKAVARRHAA